MPKITGLPAATTLQGDEPIPLVQDGKTRRATAAQVAAYAGSGKVSTVDLANVTEGAALVGYSGGTLKAWLDALQNDLLIAWAAASAYKAFTRLTVDGSGLLATASVTWPDGKTGTLTIDARDSTTNAVNAYHVTWVSGTTTKTVTQPAITRDPSDGSATVQPAITIS